jgi:uncharacterized protein YjbJ (UPF0337 family)
MEDSMTTTPSTKERAQETASTAADQSKHVAGVAKDEARHVADEAKLQARGLMNDAMTQVNEQSRSQRDRLVGTLQTVSDDLEQMASQGGRSGMATDLARQIAGKTRDLSTHLDGREPSDLLDDVRDFARRRPGMFLAGALAAGVIAGRLARGAKESQSDSGTGTAGMTRSPYDSPYDAPGGTATGAPLAGTGYPATDPAYPAGSDVGSTEVPPQRSGEGWTTP